MTPQEAYATTHWDRVAAKAGTSPVLAYVTEKRIGVTCGTRRRLFDPERDAWLSEVISWLREGGNP